MNKHNSQKNIAVSMNQLGKMYCGKRTGNREFWALRDVTLEVEKGQVWGIIGRNGAGKSTLLKLLSQVTRQTTGSFTMNGHVHSLLELGMGFHEELNGIENLFVSGSLQGMDRKKVKDNLEKIVDFSGIGDAVYQPLRTYSSGMKIRLAFALAIHADPDILILDEILAVGDEIFQRKCFEAIRNFISAGVTVLFVSHDMKLVSLICDQCLLLHEGRVVDRGVPEDVIDSYARIMGPSITKNAITVTRAQYYLQLFYKNFSVTKRFGMYCSVRSKRVWYDPAYILWDTESITNEKILLQGHYITLPLGITWELWFTDDTTLHWKVSFNVSEELHLDRFQINLMLTPHFTSWFIDSGAANSFPDKLEYGIGEDWCRHAIASSHSTIGASVRHHKFEGSIEFSVLQGDGAMTVVSSTPVFNAHLLQFLKTWTKNAKIAPGDHVIAETKIRIIPDSHREMD